MTLATAPLPSVNEKCTKGTLYYTRWGLVLLFFYLLWGDFVLQLMEAVVPAILPLQLKAMGASNMLMGALLGTVPATFNLMINPVISMRSDNYRSAWGRRIPFLMIFTPLVTLALILLAFAPEIGQLVWSLPLIHWVCRSQTAALLLVISCCIIIFQLFHYCITPVYYYLFVDVVPEAYMSRFMALFRVVIAIKAYIFSTFIYSHALTHTRAVYVGCAIVYCSGFLFMCWRVREGKYPPPEPRAQSGIVGIIKMYCRECYSHKHYLLFNMRNAIYALSFAVNIYIIFILRDELGLSLAFLGKVGGWISLISAVLLYPMGVLCDRYHPIRVVLIAMILQTPLALINFLFLRSTPSFVVLQIIGLPLTVLIAASELPLYAMIPPREHYGQFGSANQLVVSIVGIGGSILAGFYIDRVTDNGHVVSQYRYLYLWTFMLQILATFFMYLLYRSWLKHGGPNHYVPPVVHG